MRILFFIACLFFSCTLFGQVLTDCPVNAGFEEGDFKNWQCYTGTRTVNGTLNLAVSPPVVNRHTIISGSSTELDQYGKFPVSSPNGSAYSVRLGNALDGAESEKITYTFTVPANRNDFSLIYNYALVFSYSANESEAERPSFKSRVFDVAANAYIDCLSFNYIPSANLNGLRLANGEIEKFYKPWSAASINLTGYAGKTLRLEFTTTDCYFATAASGHFGYAYIDIIETCSTPVSGNIYCQADSLKLTAPYGFKEYTWYNADLSELLGTGITLNLKPAPAVNTRFAVKVVPFDGIGCPDVLYTTIRQGQGITQFVVTDTLQICSSLAANLKSPRVTAGSSADLTYTYFTDAEASVYLRKPDNISIPGTYYIKASNPTGCFAVKAVQVVFSDIDLKVTNPLPVYFPYTADITAEAVTKGSGTGYEYTYWLDEAATAELATANAITQSGTYYIKASKGDCYKILPVIADVRPLVPNTFSPNGDGINDIFNILTVTAIRTNYFRIFNRWGQQVFDSRQGGAYWDGTTNGKKQPPGSYYWVWDAYDENIRQRLTKSGQVIIIR